MASRKEFENSIRKLPKFQTDKRRPNHRVGGVVHSEVRRRKNEVAAKSAQKEVEAFRIGEPTSSFYPPPEEVGETVIFDSLNGKEAAKKSKSGDAAKKNAEIIKTILINPQSYPETKQNLGFIERHFPRILKFAKTLKNKKRLHPGIEEIFERKI